MPSLSPAPFNPAVPGAIGGTTPAAGAFTTLSATGVLTLANGNTITGSGPANRIQFNNYLYATGLLYTSGSNSAIHCLSDGIFTVVNGAGNTGPSTIEAGTFICATRLNLKSYTVATLPAAGAAGGLVYVSDAAVAPCVAFSNGTNWKRCDNAATTVV